MSINPDKDTALPPINGITVPDLTRHMDQAASQTRQLPDPEPPPADADATRLADLLAKAEVCLSEQIPAPPVCLTIEQHGHAYTIGTLGNFSVVIGKAKSRKTFLVSIALAAALRRDGQLGITGQLPDQQPLVLYFDTEQSRYHVQRVVSRICRLHDLPEPPNLKTYALRSLSTEQRVEVIEWALYNIPGVGFVVIDGGRDLIYDINDAKESTPAVGRLLKWTEDLNIHLMTVLHQNKNDTNARGHFGAELVNKAETVISVTRKGEISEVAAEQCRDRDFSPFAFGISDEGLPFLFDADKQPVSTDEPASYRPRKLNPDTMTAEVVAAVLGRVFEKELERGYSQFVTAVSEASEFLGQRLGKSRAEEFVARAFQQGHVTKAIPPAGKYPVYSLAQPPY